MIHFTIRALDQDDKVIDLISEDPASVLNIMFQTGCREADILRDGAYSFSARLDANEVWSIFDRYGRNHERRAISAALVSAAHYTQRSKGTPDGRSPGQA